MRVFSTFLLSSLLCMTVCSAATVTLFLANAYPGNAVSFTWGAANSTRLEYQGFSSMSVDSTVTFGQAWLWSNATSPVPLKTTNITLASNNKWCTDSNRNILIAYEGTDGGLTLTLPQQDGGAQINCNALPSGDAVRYIVNAACSISQLATVDIWFNGLPVKNSVTCNGFNTNYAALVTAVTGFFPSSPGGIPIAFNMPGTNTTLQTFHLATPQNPSADQSYVIVISGSPIFSTIIWPFSTSAPAPTSSPSGSAALAVQSVVVVAAMFIAVFLAKLQ